jgi:uncharacterized damage-inducible protein DinB
VIDPEREELIEQTLETWRRHAEILMDLLDAVPRGGMRAVPTGSRGRDVSAQFAHLDRVRRGWLHLHATGARPKLDRIDKDKPPTKAQLRKALKASTKEVEQYLGQALRGHAKTRMFGRKPVRWLGYLIAHESHHRGQILLALKQSDKKLPEEIAVQKIWGKWMKAE